MAFDDGIKTVSGSIAHTDDAATKVPFVSVKCGIAPTLTGVTEIDVVRPDGNILQTVATSKTQNGITWTVNADGSVTIEGTSTARTYLYVHLYHKILPKDATLTVSVEGLYDNGASDVFLNLPYSDNGTTYSGTYGQVTWGSPKKTISYTADKYLGFLLDCPANVTTNQTVKIMVTIGSDAKAFEPYVTPVTYNVELGRTIYGGTDDIVNGSGATTHNTIDMGTLTWTYHPETSSYASFFDTYLPNDSITGDSTIAFDGLTEDYKSIQSSLIALPNQPQYDDMVMALAKNTRRFIICDQRYTSASALTTALTGKILVYPILNPITFTFTPITPTPETVGNVNNVYCNTGDTELTYYDNAHGFAEVTVNRCGKNVWDEQWEVGAINVADGKNISNSNFIRSTNYIGVRPSTTYYKCAPQNILQLYYGKSKNYLSYGSWGKNGTFTTPSDCCYVRFYVAQEYGTTYNNDISINYPSTATSYEAYNGVSQTAYLHKVIYGGTADVIRGTCEPKNILDSADASHTFTSGTNTRYTIGTIALKGGVTYTFSASQKDALTSNTRNTLVINDNGDYTYEYATGSNYHNQSGVHSMQYTPNADKTVTLLIWVHTPSNDVTYSEFQVEKGSSASDFAPYFEPFTFTPISIGTDEGENTLFSNEGTSAITYRKAVD